MVWIGTVNAPGNATLVWMVGASNTRWGTGPLPLSLAPFGAPGCFLNIAPLFMTTGRTSSTGHYNNFTTPLTMPQDPLFAGALIYHQVACSDPFRPGLKVVFSTGSWCRVPPRPLPFSRIFAFGTAPAQGSVFVGYAAVTQFTYR
jgi:hypothetical protein